MKFSPEGVVEQVTIKPRLFDVCQKTSRVTRINCCSEQKIMNSSNFRFNDLFINNIKSLNAVSFRIVFRILKNRRDAEIGFIGLKQRF